MAPSRASRKERNMRATALLLALVPLLLSPALAAQEISISGTCPLRESHTFALGSSVTFTAQESPPLSAAALTPAYSPCEEIRFSGQATGKPPLTLRWLLDGSLYSTGATATVPSGRLTSGSHAMVFEVSNAHGVAQRSIPFAVQNLEFLLPPSAENLGGSKARFVANTTGATEWQWVWGDGTTSPWLAGCDGYAPTRQYAAPGTYTVRVFARNCRGTMVTSVTFPVTVTQTLAAKVLRFTASNCPLGFCIFPIGTPVLFDQAFAGTPTVYRYDWNGDGTYEQVSPAPVASHSYAAAGLYTPVVQVSDATATSTFRHSLPLLIEGTSQAPPPAPAGLALDVVAYEVSGPPTPPVPTDVWTLTHAIVSARWTDRSTDELGFNLYMSRAGGPFLLVAVIPAGITTAPNQKIEMGSLYAFRVTAYGPGGESAPSTTVNLDLR